MKVWKRMTVEYVAWANAEGSEILTKRHIMEALATIHYVVDMRTHESTRVELHHHTFADIIGDLHPGECLGKMISFWGLDFYPQQGFDYNVAQVTVVHRREIRTIS